MARFIGHWTMFLAALGAVVAFLTMHFGIALFAAVYWLAVWSACGRPRHVDLSWPSRRYSAGTIAALGHITESSAEGAFGRLDPTWQSWLNGEAATFEQERDDRRS